MDATVILLGYGAAAVGFFALLVLTAFSKVRSRQRLILLIVATTNLIWASTIACSTSDRGASMARRCGRGRTNCELAIPDHRSDGLAWSECVGTSAPTICRDYPAHRRRDLHPHSAASFGFIPELIGFQMLACCGCSFRLSDYFS